MTTRLLYALIAVVVGIISLCAAGGAILLGGGAGALCAMPITVGSASTTAIGSYDSEQVSNAAKIISVGARDGIPARGWIIAVAVALQESTLRNIDYGDRDSVGLFQQRPSQGWGTPAELLNPVDASRKFYEKLKMIPDWHTLELTDAAQRVQISAYPNAYAKWEPDATMLVEAIGPGLGLAVPADASGAVPGAAIACPGSGTVTPALRNPDGSWPDEQCSIRPDPTTGKGCLTPRTLNVVRQAKAAGFPDPSCFRVDNHGEHPRGKACDWMMTSGGTATGAHKAQGDAMAAWAVANADALGIRYVIWFRKIWEPKRGWYDYNNPWGADDAYGWHDNHVHISML